MNKNIYTETVELLRDVSRNRLPIDKVFDDPRGWEAMTRQQSEAALRKLDELEGAQGTKAAHAAMEEAGATWLHEEIMFRAEREATGGADLHPRFCCRCRKPAHPASAAFSEWGTIVDERGEGICCPDCLKDER